MALRASGVARLVPFALSALLLLSHAVLSVGVTNANAPASSNDAYDEESDACEDAGCAGREAEQCGFENNAAVLEEVARGVVKAGTKSHWAHEVLLRAVSETAPDRKPTAITQCCALGFFDASIVNQDLHMINVWATDETLGKYFAKCFLDCYQRNSWMTEEQAMECANLSLSKLVKKTKTKNWRGDNMPNMITDVIWVIDAHLADKRSQAPQKNARQHGYADTTACARVPVLIGCYMDAIGMQKSGEA